MGEAMNETRSLSENVHRLCRSHTTSMETDDGFKIATIPSLISQLRDSINPSGGVGNGGAPSKQRLPLDAHALDTYRDIEAKARELLAGCTKRPRKRTTPEEVIIAYQAAIQAFGEGEIIEASRVTGQWVRRIENILTPSRKRRPLQQPCPHCGAMWDASEERQFAVTVWAGEDIPVTNWDAYCSACGTAWLGEDIAFLLRALDAA